MIDIIYDIHFPLIIGDQAAERVSSFKFPGSTICQSLKWEVNTKLIMSKAHQRLHFLHQLRKFGVAMGCNAPILQSHRGKCSSFVHHCLVWQLHLFGEEAVGEDGANSIKKS